MSEIDEYTADVRRLQAALDGHESDYTWRVRGYWPDEDAEGTGFEEIVVRSRTKRSYDKGRLTMRTHISRDLLHDNDMAMAVQVLTHSADLTLEDMLAEAAQ